MSKEEAMSRRGFFKKSSVAAGTVLVATTGLAQTAGQLCGLTPQQTSGPFYPDHDQADKDHDLTMIRGSQTQALGKRIYVTGQVSDENCAPIPGALVEIWQACASGKYNHAGDPNPAPLDPGFQYWGKAITGIAGQYTFKTILPGAYPADTNWIRPPHIHFKIAKLGYHELVTQLYFAGNTYNAQDRILMAIPQNQRSKVIVKLEMPQPPFEPDSRVCHFNISMRRVV